MAMEALENALENALGPVDVGAALRSYLDQDELVFFERIVPEAVVARMVSEYAALRRHVHRAWVPTVRKGGTVARRHIADAAPWMHALYASPRLLHFLSALAGKPLSPKPTRDDNACALYVYERPGDGMCLHYDRCSAAEATSYTALIGLVDRSTMRLRCEMHHADPARETKRLDLETSPGSMAFFCGSKLYHGSTELARDEERVVLSLTYQSAETTGWYARVKEDMRDALVYFGVSGLVRRMR